MECILTSNSVEVKARLRMSEGHERESEHGPTSLDKNLRSNCNNQENQGLEGAEKKEVKKKRYCGNYTLFGRIEESLKTRNIAYRHKCKTWGCGVCGPKKLRSIKRAIYKEAHKHSLQRLLSLTLPGDYKGSFQDSVKDINEIWRKFREYLKREVGTIKFIKIIEPQSRGVAHLHVLIDRYIPQAWISRSWQALGGGKVCDIRFVDIHRVSGYISKYLTKDLVGDELGLYRRYSTSRDINLNEKKEKPEGEWEFLKTPIDGFWRYACKEIQEGRGTIIQMESSEGEIRMYEIEYGT